MLCKKQALNISIDIDFSNWRISRPGVGLRDQFGVIPHPALTLHNYPRGHPSPTRVTVASLPLRHSCRNVADHEADGNTAIADRRGGTQRDFQLTLERRIGR